MAVKNVLIDIFLTNLHWFWIFGFIYNFTFASWQYFYIFSSLSISLWCIPYKIDKGYGWNLFNTFFHIYNKSMEIIIVDPEDKYESCVFGFHPHGILPMAFWEIGSYFPFQNTVMFFGSQLSIIPFYKLCFYLRGQAMPATKTNVIRSLDKGKNVLISPGGVQEMICTHRDQNKLHIIAYHLGFIKYAMKYKYRVVPIVSVYEDERYQNPGQPIEKITYKLLKVPACPIFTNKYGLPWSNRLPTKIIIGKPIMTLGRELKDIQQEFYTEIKELYQSYSGKKEIILHL